MKSGRSEVHRKTHAIPELRFEHQQLTSFSGLVIFQRLLDRLDLKTRLRQCFRQVAVNPIFGHANMVLLLVVHLLLGYRELRHLRFYQDDPSVRRLLGLTRLPDVATISRLQHLLRTLMLERIGLLAPRRITLEFDGSVIGTGLC